MKYEIDELLEAVKSYGIRPLHQKLTEQGKTSIPESTFYTYTKKLTPKSRQLDNFKFLVNICNELEIDLQPDAKNSREHDGSNKIEMYLKKILKSTSRLEDKMIKKRSISHSTRMKKIQYYGNLLANICFYLNQLNLTYNGLKDSSDFSFDHHIHNLWQNLTLYYSNEFNSKQNYSAYLGTEYFRDKTDSITILRLALTLNIPIFILQQQENYCKSLNHLSKCSQYKPILKAIASQKELLIAQAEKFIRTAVKQYEEGKINHIINQIDKRLKNVKRETKAFADILLNMSAYVKPIHEYTYYLTENTASYDQWLKMRIRKRTGKLSLDDLLAHEISDSDYSNCMNFIKELIPQYYIVVLKRIGITATSDNYLEMIGNLLNQDW